MRIINGRIAQLKALIPLIAVIHSLFPSCTIIAWPTILELVTTLDIAITPIINPVLLKL